MLINHFLLQRLVSECSVIITCFSLSHLPHRQRRGRWVGGGGEVWRAAGAAAGSRPSFFVVLKRIPGVTLDASAMFWHAKLQREPQRLTAKSSSGPLDQTSEDSSPMKKSSEREGHCGSCCKKSNAGLIHFSKWTPLLIFQNVRCARGFEATRSLYPVIMLAGEKRRGVVGVIGSCGQRKGIFIKRGGRKEKAVPAAAASEHFSSAEQRQESVVVDVKWLNRPGRGRKVQKGTSIPVPIITPHFVHRQAHYLISLDALLCGRSLSELKANLQGPCCLGNRREIKWYQFWNMVKDAATRWMSLAEEK